MTPQWPIVAYYMASPVDPINIEYDVMRYTYPQYVTEESMRKAISHLIKKLRRMEKKIDNLSEKTK
jgi:hypothetical protein